MNVVVGLCCRCQCVGGCVGRNCKIVIDVFVVAVGIVVEIPVVRVSAVVNVNVVISVMVVVGHANLHSIVPILIDDPRREPQV